MTLDTISLLDDYEGIKAFSICRGRDAVIESPYSGFSVCDYTGDSPSHVAGCREQLCGYLGIDASRLILPRQTHSANVAVIDCPLSDGSTLENVDALVSTEPNIALAVNTADCVPVVLADRAAGVIGIAHSGWRGTVARIAVRTLEKMIALGARAERMEIAMGPSICSECYEVGEDVAHIFQSEFPDCVDDIVIRHDGCKPHINLSAAIVSSLIAAGVPAGSISAPRFCSYCNPGMFFSARRLGVSSGRTLTVVIRSTVSGEMHQ